LSAASKLALPQLLKERGDGSVVGVGSGDDFLFVDTVGLRRRSQGFLGGF
jgi:hypothetical protein